MKPKIYVVFSDKWKLKTYEFSTIELAKQFIMTLDNKEYVILVGNLANEGMKEI